MKLFAREKSLRSLGLAVGDEEKSFKALTIMSMLLSFFLSPLTMRSNKLEHLSFSRLSILV
jgi:hypothetical protein